jgi:hypothetical protein
MTLVLSIRHPEAIVMAADSRKTIFSTTVHHETLEPIGATTVAFGEATKLFVLPGSGCVSMWGDITRAEKHISAFLHGLQGKMAGPDELANQIEDFLKHKAHADYGDDLGFHIGGFRSDGQHALFHVFWGMERGPHIVPDDNPRDFKKHDHSSPLALYNGQNAIADSMFQFLFSLEQEVGIVTWIANHTIAKTVQFADFVLRYVAKIDPTVGGQINVAVIYPGNRVKLVKNATEAAIPIAILQDLL